MRRVLPLALVALVLALVACSADKGFHTKEVAADDYGSKWPLTVTSAVLACEPGDVVTLTVNGSSYGIDNVGAAEDAPVGLRRIWVKQDDGSHRDLSPLVDDAQALCD